MKVENAEVWEKIKANEVRGFSIEGYFVDKIEEMSKQAQDLSLDPNCDDCIDKRTLSKIGDSLMQEMFPP